MCANHFAAGKHFHQMKPAVASKPAAAQGRADGGGGTGQALVQWNATAVGSQWGKTNDFGRWGVCGGENK